MGYEPADRYVEVLRQSWHASQQEGPEAAKLLVDGQGEEVASELARDMWAFVDGLAEAYVQLEARRESWVERMRRRFRCEVRPLTWPHWQKIT